MEPILLLTEKMEVEKTFGNIKRVKHSRGITDDLARYFVYAVEHGQSVDILIDTMFKFSRSRAERNELAAKRLLRNKIVRSSPLCYSILIGM